MFDLNCCVIVISIVMGFITINTIIITIFVNNTACIAITINFHDNYNGQVLTRMVSILNDHWMFIKGIIQWLDGEKG